MTKHFSIGKYDIRISTHARTEWSHFKIHRYKATPTYRHLVWGKISISIEDATDECYAICAMCSSSEIGEQGYGDEGLTVCDACGSIEQGYRYINKRAFESL